MHIAYCKCNAFLSVCSNNKQQGVALTGRNITGPPWVLPFRELRFIIECYKLRDDDNIRQRPLLVWPLTLCVGGPVIMWVAEIKFSHQYLPKFVFLAEVLIVVFRLKFNW